MSEAEKLERVSGVSGEWGVLGIRKLSLEAGKLGRASGDPCRMNGWDQMKLLDVVDPAFRIPSV